MVRFYRARSLRAGLDRELQAVELKRSSALARQSQLAERFEAFGLPSSPVEMVKLQQLCQRNQALLERYREVCSQPGGAAPAHSATDSEPMADRHLRPDELPEAEQRLAELGASLRQRELRLQALREGRPGTITGTAVPPVKPLTQASLLPLIARMLNRLTDGRYREVRLDDGRLHLEAAPGQWVPATACSRGTTEALVLATRLAIWEASGARLPLAIDELPATFDAQRRQGALRTLERIAGDHQVLLASSDEDLVRRAVRERWQVINLKPGPGSQPSGDRETADAGQLHLL